jgi:phage tail-like protein
MPDTHGPYRNIRFMLEIGGIVKAGFSTCRIPKNRTEVIRYREGNDPPSVRKLAGLNRYGRLVLESGVTDSLELYEWYQKVQQGNVDAARRAAAIIIHDMEGNVAARWQLEGAWPASYQAPRLDATGEDVAIETLEIVCEDLERSDIGSNDSAAEAEAEQEDMAEDGGTEDGRTFDRPDPKLGRGINVGKRST